jgi:hypothetical protein
MTSRDQVGDQPFSLSFLVTEQVKFVLPAIRLAAQSLGFAARTASALPFRLLLIQLS